MNRETLGWTVVLLIGALGLFGRAMSKPEGMGKVYIKAVRIAPDSPTDTRTTFTKVEPKDSEAIVSVPRTVGVWIAALGTLAIFSFLYRDNVFYKLAESVFVGVTAAWAMVLGFWESIVDKLLRNLAPGLMRAWALPGLSDKQEPNYLYIVPLILGIMLLWRLVPRGAWIARWPLAVVVGTFAGLKLVNFLDADFVSQIRNTIIPLIVVVNGKVDPWASLRNTGLLVGVLSSLTYFFFSVEHKGFVGNVSRVGVWFLMVTFGASFAFTVMGRIALLAARVEFLFNDWLWLIDPGDKRPKGW
ncbi:MAG: hypothetical protein EXS05_05930 [Planctomycetaceae bacterium]|nr:hypothetical protein [Planctomycetaceae bacterium]